MAIFIGMWLKREELLLLLFSICVLLCSNVAADGESTLRPLTSQPSPGFDSSIVRENVQKSSKTTPTSDKKIPWISQVLSELLLNFRPKSQTNQLCNHQSDLYEKHLQNLTLWAIQMREASVGSTPGMLLGQRFHLGHYDECLEIQNPLVTGRYCVVNVKFAPTPELYADFYTGVSSGQKTPPYSTAWDVFRKPKSSAYAEKNDIWLGICVPAACTGRDVEESLSEAFVDVLENHGILLNIGMRDDSFCSSSFDAEPLPPATKYTIYAIVSLSTLCILATLYHLLIWNSPNWEDQGGLAHKIMISFSVLTNFNMLTRGTGKTNMNVLDALKVISAVQVLLKHRLVSLAMTAVHDPSILESGLDDENLLFLPTLIIETFFIVSGFLTFVICYPPLHRHGIKIFPLMIFDRWLRLMPSYLTFIAFFTFLMPYMGDGPGWKFVANICSKSCREQWWRHVLGINNFFINVKNMAGDPPCASHTWYIACDLQLFPVGLLLVYMFTKSHSAGLKSSLIALAAALAIPFLVIYSNNYSAVFTADRTYDEHSPNTYHFAKVYVPSFMRAGPYIISIISAFLLLKIQENKWTLSVISRWLILLTVTGVGLGFQFFGCVFYDTSRAYNPLENALFGAFHRSFWSLVICAIIVIQLAWGFGGYVDKLLTHKMYVPVSRLTYIVYLFHPIWQLLTAATARTPTFISVWHVIWMLAGDSLVIFGAALWLYFIVEAPTSKLRAAFMGKITRFGRSEKLQISKKSE